MAEMKNTRLELCNRIRMEAEHTEDTGFPLDVFPQNVQSFIHDFLIMPGLGFPKKPAVT